MCAVKVGCERVGDACARISCDAHVGNVCGWRCAYRQSAHVGRDVGHNVRLEAPLHGLWFRGPPPSSYRQLSPSEFGRQAVTGLKMISPLISHNKQQQEDRKKSNKRIGKEIGKRSEKKIGLVRPWGVLQTALRARQRHTDTPWGVLQTARAVDVLANTWANTYSWVGVGLSNTSLGQLLAS